MRTRIFITVFLLVFLGGVALFVAGCQTGTSISQQGGAQLWANNCTRCHNMRSPQMLSDEQWDVVGQHMRLRANLTAEEHRKIVEFLKSSN